MSNQEIVKLTAQLTLIAIVVGVICLFLFRFNTTNVTFMKSRSVDISTLPGQCDIDYNAAPDISDLPCCKDSSGQVTSSKYLPQYDLVVSNNPQPYLAVCSQFCKNGVSEDQQNCIDVNGYLEIDAQQRKFNQCIDLTKPTDCIGDVKPVAYQGITRYYAYSATDSLCKNTAVCQN